MRLETDDVEAVAGAARPGIAEALRRRLAGGRDRRWIAPLVLVAVAIYLGSGVFTVAADEQAVVRRFGRVTARLGPGIHYRLPWPVDRVDVLKTTTVMKTGVGFDLPEGEAPTVSGMEVLTGDTNIISVAMTLQYVIRNPAAFLFDVESPQALIGSVAESVLTETVVGMPVDEVLTTGRLAVQSYKEQRVAEAIGNTTRFLELLAEYRKAPDITRSRLYLEAVEKILPRVRKFVIDSRQGQHPVNLRFGPPQP